MFTGECLSTALIAPGLLIAHLLAFTFMQPSDHASNVDVVELLRTPRGNHDKTFTYMCSQLDVGINGYIKNFFAMSRDEQSAEKASSVYGCHSLYVRLLCDRVRRITQFNRFDCAVRPLCPPMVLWVISTSRYLSQCQSKFWLVSFYLFREAGSTTSSPLLGWSNCFLCLAMT